MVNKNESQKLNIYVDIVNFMYM